MKTKITAYGEQIELTLKFSNYLLGDRLSIRAETGDGEPYGTLTTNLPDQPLNPGEIFVKTYSENAAWVPQVLKNLPELFTDTGRRVKSGFVTIPVYQVRS